VLRARTGGDILMEGRILSEPERTWKQGKRWPHLGQWVVRNFVHSAQLRRFSGSLCLRTATSEPQRRQLSDQRCLLGGSCTSDCLLRLSSRSPYLMDFSANEGTRAQACSLTLRRP